MNIPLILTLTRVALIPFIIILYYIPFEWARIAAAVAFTIAGITDWLDGYIARKLNQTSKFGAFLDPAVDKLVVAIALVLLVSNPNLPFITLPVLVIIGREIVISSLREWMAELGKRASVAVKYMGKIKTTIQIISIVILLGCNPEQDHLFTYLGYLLLYIAAILTIWTMTIYFKAAWPDLKFN